MRRIDRRERKHLPERRAMTATRFWKIIETSRRHFKRSACRQENALRTKLQSLTPREIVAFSLWFDAFIRRAYTWDLWGAAFIIQRGCSNDGFWDFRSWLVAQGRSIYEAAIRDPESLARFPKGIGRRSLNFTEPGPHVWKDQLKTSEGAWIDDFPCLGSNLGETPRGREFSDTPAKLKARYPRLWKKFGWPTRK